MVIVCCLLSPMLPPEMLNFGLATNSNLQWSGHRTEYDGRVGSASGPPHAIVPCVSPRASQWSWKRYLGMRRILYRSQIFDL